MPKARPPSVTVHVPPPPPDPPPPAPGGARPAPPAAAGARAVRDLRVAAGLSERAAARLLGTSQTQLRRGEAPRYLPSLRSLARLAAAYGHRLRVEFEPRDRQGAKAARPPARAKAPVPKARRPTPARPRASRSKGRRG